MNRLRDWMQRQSAAYRGTEQRPLGGYLAVLGVYVAGLGALGVAGRLTARELPERVSAFDLALLAVATHRLSRSLAKDPVTSPLRAPFAHYEGLSAAAELDESVRGDGLRHSVGELVTCPMCLAQWVATAFTAGLVYAPRQTRLAMAALGAIAGADFLQYVYAYLQQATE